MEAGLMRVSLNAHLISFIASLRKMKENEVMTDVTLILPDQSAISCHKVILTAGCSLFRSLKESAEQEIRLDFADSDTIRTLIEFPYSGFVNMTDDHLMTLVAASTRLCHKNAANSLIGLHVMSFMTSLHEMKERQVMTDVTLILPDQSTISCHKVVLMATSIFFETMFQSGLKERLFLVGEDDQCVRFQADRDRKTLTSIPWKPPRQSSTLCFFGGKIFAFGGCTIGENTPLKFVASFNVEDANPDWRLEKEMLIAIEEPCVVHFADKMFVFGGRIGNTFSVVSQEFDPISNEWRLLSEMPGPCHGVAAVALNNKIYVVGGLNRVCYSFDPVNDEWKSLSPPTQLCLDGSATVWKGKILLSAYLCTSLVQEYDPATDRWSKQNQLTAHEPQQYFLFSLCY
ncbi:hypothetical protein CAPTEDRAFT_206095 [Capitella teleta]|uniref:BTB domain-containing protein n=1 Tax=Capitella teleta TaxID=283909 RepID=R7VHE0_CAPTE|nr:hypothetical protein CAPTEDRAFT_206095 [Capitella teleta]|eukprot:ELU15691.1 hypothetical protein CAPTEDRAFT_206095 [Capitella teleta]